MKKRNTMGTMAEDSVDLGHATEEGVRVDGLANVLTGMGQQAR
jgi:hypothetical protein